MNKKGKIMKTTQSLNRTLFLMFGGLFLTLVLFISGCSESPVTSSAADNLEVSTYSSTTADNNTGGNVLVLTTVKVLIKDIKLNVSGSGESNFKTGPYVLYLGLNSSVNTMTTGIIPVGTYDKIKFEIHKPNNNDSIPDPEFRDEFGNYSVIAKGTFNGTAFTYKSKKSAHQMLNMNSELIMMETGRTNITLTVNPYSWFLSGGIYMDPDIASNENDIDNNIKASFKAIIDKDKNGIPD